MTNEELYRQYLSGDAEAFEQLYLQMQGFIAFVAKDAAQSFGCTDKEILDELCAEGALELCERLSVGVYFCAGRCTAIWRQISVQRRCQKTKCSA